MKCEECGNSTHKLTLTDSKWRCNSCRKPVEIRFFSPKQEIVHRTIIGYTDPAGKIHVCYDHSCPGHPDRINAS